MSLGCKSIGALILGLSILGGALGLIGTSTFGPAEAQARSLKERHPHIRRAISELRSAREELRKADHDFGGHRKEALEAVDVAIRQLGVALRFDRK
jgi:hypothetical protein